MLFFPCFLKILKAATVVFRKNCFSLFEANVFFNEHVLWSQKSLNFGDRLSFCLNDDEMDEENANEAKTGKHEISRADTDGSRNAAKG